MEKKKVIEALNKNDEPQKQFNELLQLFIKHPHHGPSLAKYYNASGFSKANLDTLKYDIKQTYGITDAEVRNFVPEKKQPVNDAKSREEKVMEIDFENSSEADLIKQAEELIEFSNIEDLIPAAIPKFAKGLPGNKEMLAWLSEREITPESKKSDDLKALIEKTQSQLESQAKQKAVENLKKAQASLLGSIEVNEETSETEETEAAQGKKEIQKAEASEKQLPVPGDEAQEKKKLREEFPFLNEKDCPDKFKILVADKYSALKAYHDAFEEIQRKKKAGDNEGLFELGKTATENWELNQLIYDELNYYQEHKQILGNHPIFVDDVLQKKVAAYSTQEAMKRQGNLRSYISRDTKKLEGIKDAKKKENAEAKIKEWQDELDLIDKRLNADAEKK